MTPAPIDIVAALPIACTPLSTIKPVKLFDSASPIFAPKYTTKVPMKIGRRPMLSLIGPQKEGAKPWRIMYTVTVRETSDTETLSC